MSNTNVTIFNKVDQFTFAVHALNQNFESIHVMSVDTPTGVSRVLEVLKMGAQTDEGQMNKNGDSTPCRAPLSIRALDRTVKYFRYNVEQN